MVGNPSTACNTGMICTLYITRYVLCIMAGELWTTLELFMQPPASDGRRIAAGSTWEISKEPSCDGCDGGTGSRGCTMLLLLLTNQSSEAKRSKRERDVAVLVKAWCCVYSVAQWVMYSRPIAEGWPYDNISSSGTANLLPHLAESPTPGGGAIHDIAATQGTATALPQSPSITRVRSKFSVRLRAAVFARRRGSSARQGRPTYMHDARSSGDYCS